MNLKSLERKLAYYSTFSNHKQHKMSCAIMNKNQIVAWGMNLNKTHTKSITPYNTLHAEIYCLIGLDIEKTRGCTAIVFRQNKQGNKVMAKPCPGCEMALKLAGIKRVYYTEADAWKEMKL